MKGFHVMQQDIVAYLEKTSNNFKTLQALAPSIAQAAQLCIDSIRAGGKIMICGNGGSAADAQHMAAEMTGRYKIDRPGLPALALTVDSSALTSISNDYGFEQVFSRQVEGLAKPGDVLIGISTSGTSRNVLAAITKGHEIGVKVIGLTGETGGRMKEVCDVWLGVPSLETNFIQEMHLAIEHMICGFVEEAFAPPSH